MLIYLDLKSTGLQENDRVCALGLIIFDTQITCIKELMKPPKKVRSEASALHHITNEMLLEKKDFAHSAIKTILEKYNNAKSVFVGHNIGFDLVMLQKEGFIFQGSSIDTLKCSRALIPECEQFSLQYLRYELKLYRDEKKLADQLGIQADALLSDALYTRLLHQYLLEMADDTKLLALSSQPVLLQKLNFGKYKGYFLEEIAMNDRNYLLWLLKSAETLDEDLRYSILYHMKML